MKSASKMLSSENAIGNLLKREMIIYGKEMSPQGFEIFGELWCEEFSVYPEHLIKEALDLRRKAASDNRFFPMPGEVHSAIRKILSDRLEPVWQALKKLISAYGKYYSLDLGNPALHYAIQQAGGWVELCSITPAELIRKKDLLLGAYIDSMSLPENHLPERLIGLHEEGGCPAIKKPDMKKYLPAEFNTTRLLTQR